MKALPFFLLPLLLSTSLVAQSLDIQGHRGCRGLRPENTLSAFRHAMELGVTTLELDVIISGDGQVVVSHEPWINGVICTSPEGEVLPENKALNIYQMTYAEIRTYDCGSQSHPNFPDQESSETYKPLLSEVLATMELEAQAMGRPPLRYNIELKSKASTDRKFHPAPAEFSQRVYAVIKDYVPWERVTIQSFDFRVLQYWHEKHPQVTLAALSARPLSPGKLTRALGFTPDIYSPYFKLVSAPKVAQFQEAGMQVIPWTVNTREDMQKVMAWGVEGIITDYPNRLIDLMKD